MSDEGTKVSYLVGFDYGMGGLWAFVRARSKQEILDRYPRVDVFDAVPDFVKPFEEELRCNSTYDIDDPPAGPLAALIDTD